MADKKISELVSLIGANAATGDLLPIVDISATETKKITRDEFFKNIPSIDINGGTIDGTAINTSTIDGTVIGGSVPAEVTASQYNSTEALPDIKPSLNLDFANTKKLDPRITFTRGSTAAYYDGVTFAKAEENLLIRSQEFDNAAWLLDNVAISADTENAPDGTATADTAVEDISFNPHRARRVLAGSGVVTLSVFAKAGVGSRFLTIGVNNSIADYASATFDLSAGTNTQTLVAGTYSAQSATITAFANGFYRCSLTVTTDSIGQALIGLSAASTFANASRGFDRYTGDGTSSIILWGAQLEQRSAVTDYTPTTTQPITNYIPALQTAASGEARFDHDPITGESKGLLIEEARTNLVTYSEQFDDASWNKSRASIAANIVVSPDGTLTGSKLVEDTTATNTHGVSKSAAVAASTTVTASIYAKAGERTEFALRCAGSAFIGRAFFNLSTGSLGSRDAGVTSSSITSVGNGWYRCTATYTTLVGGTTANVEVQMAINGGVSYTGDGYSGIYIWGAQLEAGAFPTSYIPTVASQVTRSADDVSMTGTNFSSWYRQDEGTVYSEAQASAQPASFFAYVANISEGSTSLSAGGFLRLSVNSAQKADLTIGNFGSFTTINTSSFPTLQYGEFSKMGIAWRVNDAAGASNGVTPVVTSARQSVSPVDRMFIGSQLGSSRFLNGHVKKLSFYPQRLSNATLQALTEE